MRSKGHSKDQRSIQFGDVLKFFKRTPKVGCACVKGRGINTSADESGATRSVAVDRFTLTNCLKAFLMMVAVERETPVLNNPSLSEKSLPPPSLDFRPG